MKPPWMLRIGFLLLLFLCSPSAAQISMPRSVVASGGGFVSGGGIYLKFTVQQPAIGLASSAANTAREGFWYVAEFLTSEAAEPPLPVAFLLWPGRPNPFRDDAVIRYETPRPCRVRLAIYDVTGRAVRVLADREEQPGIHTVNLRDADLPSGIYFCRMTADRYTRTIRLVRIR